MPRLNPRALEISRRDSGVEPSDEISSLESGTEVRANTYIPDASHIAAWRWVPGQSGNPAGRPKRDVAADIARGVFERNPELIYKALAHRLTKSGDPYAFKELADRGYGKLKDKLEVSGMDEMAELLGRARKRAELPVIEGEVVDDEG